MNVSERISRRYSELYQHLVPAEGQLAYPAELPPEAVSRFANYLDLLQLWTVKVDLVAPGSVAEHLEQHVIDSIAAGMMFHRYYSPPPEAAYFDLGSGAGLPGLILAVMEPERSAILCEPREKRAIFLKEAASNLDLARVFVLCERAEKVSVDGLAQPGIFWTRALGDTSLLLQTAARLGRPNSYVVELGGPNWNDAEYGKKLGLAELVNDIPYSLSPDGPRRRLIVWQTA